MASSSCCFSSLLSHLQPQHHSRRPNHARIAPSDITSAPQDLEAGLDKELQKPIYGKGDSRLNVMSFTQICKAFDAVIATQASIKHIVSTSTVPVAGGPMSNKMIQQFTEDSVKMLDACCLLKETLAGRDAHVKASLRALKRLQSLKMANQGEIQRAKHTLLSAQRVQGIRMQQQNGAKHKLQTCTSFLRRMGKKLNPSLPTHHHHLIEMASSSACVNAVPVALYGGEMCALFFLRLLSMALSSPASSSFLTTASNKVSDRPVWGPSLLVLKAQLHTHILHLKHKRTQDLGSFLPELQTLDASLNQIRQALLQPPSTTTTQQAKDNNLRILVSSTMALAADVQSSIARLQHQLDCISSSILDTRMALLDSPTSPLT